MPDWQRKDGSMSSSSSGTIERDAASDAAAVETARGTRRGSILIVDDSQSIRESLVKILEKEGYHTLDTDNGHSALKVLDHQDVDLLLTDLKMPGMDGLELTQQAKKLK